MSGCVVRNKCYIATWRCTSPLWLFSFLLDGLVTIVFTLFSSPLLLYNNILLCTSYYCVFEFVSKFILLMFKSFSSFTLDALSVSAPPSRLINDEVRGTPWNPMLFPRKPKSMLERTQRGKCYYMFADEDEE